MKLTTTRLPLAPRLGMSGTIPLLLLHAFIAWTGTTLHLPFYYFTGLIFLFSCAQGNFNHTSYDIFTRVTYTESNFVSLQYYEHYLPLTLTFVRTLMLNYTVNLYDMCVNVLITLFSFPTNHPPTATHVGHECHGVFTALQFARLSL